MKILYTGIGATKDEHTEVEFLTIMKREFIDKDWSTVSEETKVRQLSYENWNLPTDFILFTFMDWMEYAGASLISN
jgi:hypothetical protein